MRRLVWRTIFGIIDHIQTHAHAHAHAEVAASHDAAAIEGANCVHALRIIVQILHGHHLRQQVSYVRGRTTQLVLMPVEIASVNAKYY